MRRFEFVKQNTIKNVTFLIGNGFDVGLGLDTTYRNFLDWYLKQECPNNDVIIKFRDYIKKDIINWSDAELAFGRLPFSDFCDDFEKDFLICLKDFQSQLHVYLCEQEARLDTSCITDEIYQQFRKSLIGVLHYAVYKDPTISSSLFGISKDTINVNVINFNYTSAFDLFFKGHQLEETQVDEGSYQKFLFKECIHVHGNLKSPDKLLFGVNDESQISDSILKFMSSTDGYLIKFPMAEEHGGSDYFEAIELLQRSDLVVLFGLSYGVTDIEWWELITEGLMNEEIAVLLCPYKPEPTKSITTSDRIYVKKTEIKRFLNQLNYDFEEFSESEAYQRMTSLSYGPFEDPENGESYYCDPLNLNYFGRHCVKDFARNPILLAK